MKVNRIPEDETINKEKADELFRKHAILFEKADAVPEDVVIELFGKDAAKCTIGRDGCKFNLYSTRAAYDKIAGYFTLAGFYNAVSFHNIQAVGSPLFED